jgi:outer membrane protein TolC
MHRTTLTSLVLCLPLILGPAHALAQPTPAPKPPPARAGSAAQTPAAAAPGAPAPAQAPATALTPAGTQAAAPAAPTGPRAIEVDDPLLAPVPPAKNVLTEWRQVLTLINTRSTDLRIADQEIERAEGLVRQALGRALPTITATGSLNHDLTRGDLSSGIPGTPSISGTTSTFSAIADLSVRQPILAPRIWYGIGTARLSVKAAQLDADDRRRIVLAAVASAILSVVTAERVSEINRVGLRSSLERLELTQRRARLGTGTKLDIVRAEQDATLARTQLVANDQGLLQAREALGLTLGSSDTFSVTPTISINEIEQSLKTLCSPGKPEQRADVVAADTNVQVAERLVRDAKLGWAPFAEVSTSLTASAGSTKSLSPAAPADGRSSLSWSIGALLTIPIWDGGSRYGEIRSAKAGVEQQKARLDAAKRSAEIEVSQAQRTVVAAEQARTLSERNRDLAKETSRLSQIAFEAGTATSFELVDAGRREREAELDLAVREFELIKAKLSALLATANCKY